MKYDEKCHLRWYGGLQAAMEQLGRFWDKIVKEMFLQTKSEWNKWSMTLLSKNTIFTAITKMNYQLLSILFSVANLSRYSMHQENNKPWLSQLLYVVWACVPDENRHDLILM